jgi:hypothetical protein
MFIYLHFVYTKQQHWEVSTETTWPPKNKNTSPNSCYLWLKEVLGEKSDRKVNRDQTLYHTKEFDLIPLANRYDNSFTFISGIWIDRRNTNLWQKTGSPNLTSTNSMIQQTWRSQRLVITHLAQCMGNGTWYTEVLNQYLLNKGIKEGIKQYLNSIIKRFCEQASPTIK